MKHIFLINPAAGNGKAGIETLPAIIAAVKSAGVDYEIHRTVNIGDATNYVREHREKNPDAEMRYYACGGDGTVNEVLNGIIGSKNAQLAIIPAGTGNDFVRNFGTVKQFKDIEKQLEGHAITVDALKYELLDYDETEQEELRAQGIRTFPPTGYAINMFNMGFDAEVVARTAELKKRPLISGTMAYVSGVASVLAKLKKLPMLVEVDGKVVDDDNFIIAGATNGRFSGGGFDGMPFAITNDGLMDVLLVHSLTRRFFISIIKKYHDGTHFNDPRIEGIIEHFACKEAVFRPKIPMILAIDGETMETRAVRISIVPNAVELSLPADLTV
jgi:YegS/Rv2252/BmrU family lipid kinase